MFAEKAYAHLRPTREPRTTRLTPAKVITHHLVVFTAGQGWIRTTVGNTGRFTACCFRPLSHLPMHTDQQNYRHTSTFFFVRMIPRLWRSAFKARLLCVLYFVLKTANLRFRGSHNF